MDEQLRQAALDFHQFPQPGKIQVAPTKPLATQRDLAVFVAQSVRGVHKVSSFIFVPGVAYAAMDYGRHDEGVEAEQASPDDFPALSSPLAADDAGGRSYSPTVSPMRALAYRVLGIGSIQDELLIKP